ncbi:protein modifying enzyme [Lithospermum erythrorhizon]|uniref:O-fucosyltransferase family protein n=1 Tax=Lithospermum erythrorhizon TaxID=34254 RepID=A0AAV3PU68_LITER
MNNKWKRKHFSNTQPPILRSPLLTISLLTVLLLILLFFFTSNRFSTSPLSGSRSSQSTLLNPLCSSTLTPNSLGIAKFIWYAPHSGFSNQLSEFKNAVLMSAILNRTLIVPPILDHHAVALGSCPKFRVLSPNDLRFAVWNHTIQLLWDQRYVSMADIIDLSELIANSGLEVIDFRVFISIWCGVQIDSLCSRDLETFSAISESLQQCGSLLSGYNGNINNCLYASGEDCTNTVWTYQKDEEDGSLDVFQPDEQIKKKKKISFVRRRRDVYQTFGPGSKAESAQVLALGSMFTAPYKGSESHIDVHEAPKDQRIQSLIEKVEYLPFISEIVAAGKKFALQTIRAPFLCAQLRLVDGQFKNHWETTFQRLRQELEPLKQKGPLPIHVFVMTDLPATNWSGSYLGDVSKDSKTYKLFMLREDDHLLQATAKKINDAERGIILHSSLKHLGASGKRCAPRILPDVLLYVEETICSCASLGFVGTAGSTIAESITVMRKQHVC